MSLLFILLFFYAVIYPQSQLKQIRMKRMSKLKAMEKRHGCKVLTMIHRREAISVFGLPAYQYIDEEDAEQILRWIRQYQDYPLELILHTPGGQLHASIQIARALRRHPKNTKVIIPHYSLSGELINLEEIAAEKGVLPDALKEVVADRLSRVEKVEREGKLEKAIELEKYQDYILLENYLIHRQLLERIDKELEKPGAVETYADAVKVFEIFGLDRSLYYPVLEQLGYKVIWTGLSEENAKVRKAED